MDLTIMRIWLNARLGIVRDDRGANLVEYILLIAFIAIIVIVAIRVLGGSVSTKFSRSDSALR